MFLQQTVTSKCTPSQCSFTIGADSYTKTKYSNEMPNNYFTMHISHTDVLTYPPTPHNSHKHLHICTQPKIKTFRCYTNPCSRLHSLLCSHNSHTNHCSEQNESNPPHLFTLLLEDPFATHHNQMHILFGLIMRGGCVKKWQCETVKFLATVPTLLCENNG